MEMRRAESFNVLVAAQIGYFITCRFLKRTTLHYRVFLGNWVAYVSIAVTIGIMVRWRPPAPCFGFTSRVPYMQARAVGSTR